MILNVGIVHGPACLGHGLQVIGRIQHRLHGVGSNFQQLAVRSGQPLAQLGLHLQRQSREGRLRHRLPGVVLVDAQRHAPEVLDLAAGAVGQHLPPGLRPRPQRGQVHFLEVGVPARAAVEDGGTQSLDAQPRLGQGLEGVGPVGADVVRRGPEDGNGAHQDHRGQHQPPGEPSALHRIVHADRVGQQQNQHDAGQQHQPEYRRDIHHHQAHGQNRPAGQGHRHGAPLPADRPGGDPGQGQGQQAEDPRRVAAGLAQDGHTGIAPGKLLRDGVKDTAQTLQKRRPEPHHRQNHQCQRRQRRPNPLERQKRRTGRGPHQGRCQENPKIRPQGKGVVQAHLGRKRREGGQQHRHQNERHRYFLWSHGASSWGETWQRQVARGKLRPSMEGVSSRSGARSSRPSSGCRSSSRSMDAVAIWQSVGSIQRI